MWSKLYIKPKINPQLCQNICSIFHELFSITTCKEKYIVRTHIWRVKLLNVPEPQNILTRKLIKKYSLESKINILWKTYLELYLKILDSDFKKFDIIVRSHWCILITLSQGSHNKIKKSCKYLHMYVIYIIWIEN